MGFDVTETEAIRSIAAELVEKSRDASVSDLATTLDKLTQAFKSLHEADKNQAELLKLTADTEKLR